MSYHSKILLLVVAAVAVTMVLPGTSALHSGVSGGATPAASVSIAPASSVVATSALSAAGPSAASSAAAVSSATAVAAGTQGRVLSELKALNAPMKDVFLPNFAPDVSIQGGVVTPLYDNTPAPMGIGDFGVVDQSGHNVATVTYAPSVKASVTLNNVDPVYVTSSAPDEFTMQLNTVASNIDLFGSDSYQFWLQNVPIYSETTQTLSFEDNVWNFSNPSTTFQASSIYAHGPGGFVDGNLAYIAVGPSFHVPTPFTVVIYNNLTLVDGRSTVFFNYTVIPSTGSPFSGSYDFVEFNSTPEVTGPAPQPVNEINGGQVNPTGFLLDDAEIMLGGPGGGSTTTLFNIAGSMGLWLLPNGSKTYKTVPSAYDFGTDTGETSEGIAEYATTGSSHTAELGSGPSMLYGLWGLVGAHPGKETITLDLSPSNAFVFASPGATFNESAAGWGPTPVTGPAVYQLPPGAYSFEYLLADHNPAAATYGSSGTWTVSLSSNPSLGDYTPLWAESNSQLAGISQGGKGTSGNPYVLDNGPANINPLFGEVNDYDFQVFPGIYLLGTTAFVTAADLPAFQVTYLPSQIAGARLIQDGLPLTDQLNVELYETSHVSIIDSDQLSGWFAAFGSFGEPATIYLWGATNTLIADNTFYVESDGITAAGYNATDGGHNLIWGNVFYPEPVVSPSSAFILNYGLFPAFWEFESLDVVFNNAFLTPITAVNFQENFYTGAGQLNHDQWNVKVQPSTDVRAKNGFDLSGSILGLSWEGGNYWANYGTPQDPYGVLPYNDGGLIQLGGDSHPLIPFTLYDVRFTETGLPSGSAWSVTINGYTQTTTGKSITFVEPNGTYAFVVTPPAGFTASPSVGGLIVAGLNVLEKIGFT
ncbi:MAG: thermopsin family protease [Thermoplasmata archaeon]